MNIAQAQAIKHTKETVEKHTAILAMLQAKVAEIEAMVKPRTAAEIVGPSDVKRTQLSLTRKYGSAPK